MNSITNSVQLGLGLIGIGRPWGFAKSTLPEESAVEELLQRAMALDITFFDTAPSYGLSEERLGRFLSMLSRSERNRLTVATKFGECWNHSSHLPYVDHSYDGLCRSLDRSLSVLGKVDILQLHKTNKTVLKSSELQRAFEYAVSSGVTALGVSVSDFETGVLACEASTTTFIQFPYNEVRSSFRPIFQLIERSDKKFIVNRPLNMGELLYVNGNEENKQRVLIEAFLFILREGGSGVILSGTSSADHLQENVEAFKTAMHFFRVGEGENDLDQ